MRILWCLVGSAMAVDQKVSLHSQQKVKVSARTQTAKNRKHMKVADPDDDQFDYAEDDDDDPADYGVDQFIGDDFLQLKSKTQTTVQSDQDDMDELAEEHYFNTVEGEDEMDDEEAKYDDSFIQMAIKAHVKLDKQEKEDTAPNFLQLKKSPDDDEYDYAEDDDDDPADYSVNQFLDDDNAFIQVRKLQHEDDDLADNRLDSSEYISKEEFNQLKRRSLLGKGKSFLEDEESPDHDDGDLDNDEHDDEHSDEHSDGDEAEDDDSDEE